MKKKIAIIFAVNLLVGGLVLCQAFSKIYTLETMSPWMFAPLGICYIPYFILPGMYEVHNWFLTLPCVCMLNATLVSGIWHMILVRKKRNKPTCVGNTVLTRFFWIVWGGVLLLPLLGHCFPSEQMEYQRLKDALVYQNYAKVKSIVRKNPLFLKKRVYMLQSEPLVFAVEHADMRMATILLQAGANPDGFLEKGEPISWAIGYEDTGLLSLLISHGADIEVEGRSSLLSVASYCLNLNAIKILIAKDARINSRDSIGQIALIEAVQSRRVSSSRMPDGTEKLMPVVVFLLQHGANPLLKDDAGKNAIDYAKQRAALFQGTSIGKAFEDIYKLLTSPSLPVSNQKGRNEQVGRATCCPPLFVCVVGANNHLPIFSVMLSGASLRAKSKHLYARNKMNGLRLLSDANDVERFLRYALTRYGRNDNEESKKKPDRWANDYLPLRHGTTKTDSYKKKERPLRAPQQNSICVFSHLSPLPYSLSPNLIFATSV